MSKLGGNEAVVVSVCVSSGGIPKIPQPSVQIGTRGIDGDAHDHDKHNKPSRALCLLDEEILFELRQEGYDVVAGSIGENITVRNLSVQTMPPGTILQMGEVKLRLEESRKPCFVLDAIDDRLKDDVVGRCGYMASVVAGGTLAPGTPIFLIDGPSRRGVAHDAPSSAP